MINRLFLFLSVMLFTSSALAVAPTVWWPKFGENTPFRYNTGEAACDGISVGGIGKLIAVTGSYVQCDYKGEKIGWSGQLRCSATTLPDTTKPSASQCSDPVVPPPTCTDTSTYIRKFVMKENGSFPKEYDKCAITPLDVLVCRREKINGVATDICMVSFKRTGSPAEAVKPTAAVQSDTPEDKTAPVIPIPPTKADSPNSNCPTGSVQGGSDSSGIPICIGTGSTPPSTKTTLPVIQKAPVTVTNSDGSKTTTTTTVSTNSDGSTTTTNEVVTVAPDGTKTTTGDASTSPNSTGGSGKADEKTSDFCKSNPTLSVCRNSGVSGTCGEITCTGDAIQCATLRATATMECREKQDRSDAAASDPGKLGAQLAAGTDPLKSSLPSAANAQVVQMPGTLDQSGFLSGAAFFADTTVTVRGHTVTIPWSKAAPLLLAFRYAMMLVAALASFKIIRSAVLT
jgi:hypothetical protein